MCSNSFTEMLLPHMCYDSLIKAIYKNSKLAYLFIYLNIKHRNHRGSRVYINFLGNATLYHVMFSLSLCASFSSLTGRAVNTLLHSSTELLDIGLSLIIVLLARAFSWERSSGYQSLLSRTMHPGPFFLSSQNSEHHHTLPTKLCFSWLNVT